MCKNTIIEKLEKKGFYRTRFLLQEDFDKLNSNAVSELEINGGLYASIYELNKLNLWSSEDLLHLNGIWLSNMGFFEFQGTLFIDKYVVDGFSIRENACYMRLSINLNDDYLYYKLDTTVDKPIKLSTNISLY